MAQHSSEPPREGQGQTRAGKRKRMLLGLGLDGQDGEKRITLSDNFQLYGGSQETHEVMQEKAIKINEHLGKRGKTLDNVGHDEFAEIAGEVGLTPVCRQDD